MDYAYAALNYGTPVEAIKLNKLAPNAKYFV